MSEKNKDLYASSKEQIKEIIDTKDINEKLWKLSEKSTETKRNSEAVLKIWKLQKKLWANYDVKYTINKNWAYILQINWHTLDIEIVSMKRLDKVIESIEAWLLDEVDNPEIKKIKELTWLWDNKLSLNWDITGRSIIKNSSVLPVWFDDKIAKTTNKVLSKNDVEEIFVFLMNVKWIKKEDWKISSTICANNVITDECKDDLWN